MSEFKMIKYEAKDSLRISGHEVDGVGRRDENFFLEWRKTEEVILILTGVNGLC